MELNEATQPKLDQQSHGENDPRDERQKQLLKSPQKNVNIMTWIQSMQSTEKDAERLTMPDTMNKKMASKLDGVIVENVADLQSYNSNP